MANFVLTAKPDGKIISRRGAETQRIRTSKDSPSAVPASQREKQKKNTPPKQVYFFFAYLLKRVIPDKGAKRPRSGIQKGNNFSEVDNQLIFLWKLFSLKNPSG